MLFLKINRSCKNIGDGSNVTVLVHFSGVVKQTWDRFFPINWYPGTVHMYLLVHTLPGTVLSRVEYILVRTYIVAFTGSNSSTGTRRYHHHPPVKVDKDRH